MKNSQLTMLVGMVSLLIFLVSSAATAAEKVPQDVIDHAHSVIAAMGIDPIIVNAVKEENRKGKTMEDIKKMDKRWMATPGLADFMLVLKESTCGKHLQEIQKTSKIYAELFVMDNQGALVCMSAKTSDYWQGDEAKFTESYKKGSGALHIGEIEFDDSSQAYLVQVSVPVKDDDMVIGALTVGVDIDAVESQR